MIMEVEAPCGGNAGEGRWSKLASSRAVANVQALAASAAEELTADTIERYIQPDIDAHTVLAEHSDEVPVIDLAKLLNAETVEDEAARLKFACEEWGFFQVVNHGVPDEVIVDIKHNLHKFFELPLDVKNAYARRPGDLQGYGQAFILSDDQKLDWADMFGIFTQPPEARDMSYWSTQPATFRMNYYPPCTSTPEKVLGFSPHSDGSFITILLEVNSVPGLQIRRHGAWIPVKPRGDALLVNVGDFLEIMTNGRVLYKTMTVEEYARLYLSNKPDGKSNLDYAKLS
ncbi:unnamed protein product [Alopecurus aequalis]